MIRIAIIDHEYHSLYVEDIDEEILNDKYEGSEQKYIEDNYDLGEYSWDYIVDSTYFPKQSDPIDIKYDLM